MKIKLLKKLRKKAESKYKILLLHNGLFAIEYNSEVIMRNLSHHELLTEYTMRANRTLYELFCDERHRKWYRRKVKFSLWKRVRKLS